MAAFLLVCLFGYVIGSVPTAIWVSKYFYRTDILSVGSRNPGMTNVLRVLGWKPAIPVALADVFKGFAAAAVGASLLGTQQAALAGGVFAVLGHSFSFLARFRGGKSVLTGLGVFLFFAPWSCLAVLVIWGLVTWRTRYVSLASIISALALPLLVYSEAKIYPDQELLLVTWAAVVISAFVVIRHQPNIVRLWQGTENKFGRKKDG